MNDSIDSIITYITSLDGINDKNVLIWKLIKRFQFRKDGKVYYNNNLAIRFCITNNWSFSNTVLALSNLLKFDNKPFIVCLISKKENKNILYLANTTFLRKISHSSKELSFTNIKWSFNWSDIMKEYCNIKNTSENFQFLFDLHKEIETDDNLLRLVEETNNISPSWSRFQIEKIDTILSAPTRAAEFVKSPLFEMLKSELDHIVSQYKNEILIASFIDNTKIRWIIIEYLIAWEDIQLKEKLIHALNTKTDIPPIKNKNSLWDYQKVFKEYRTETDIKTKIMILNSNPKAYNIDKLLEFLSEEKSVFLFYFIWINEDKSISQSLISIFQTELQQGTLIQHHWCSRASRWETQFNWEVIKKLIRNENNSIDITKSKLFLQQLINK